jgi:hypothetical protein
MLTYLTNIFYYLKKNGLVTESYNIVVVKLCKFYDFYLFIYFLYI